MKILQSCFLVFSFSVLTVFSSIGQSNDKEHNTPGSQLFKTELLKYCGKSFQGEITSALQNDTLFTGKTLIMHVKSCEENRIRIPFFVGEDRSRTWVLTFDNDRILLKHDHRMPDGSEDHITQYGGRTTNSGSATLQVFPADQETADLIPAAAGNIWWIEMVPGKSFSYNLRRIGTERLFTVTFDLTKEVETPLAPWGWKD